MNRLNNTIDFTKVLYDPFGRPISIANEDGSTEPMTLGRASMQALFFDPPGSSPSGEDKFMRASLAFKIKDNNEAILTIEEIALIKKQLGMAFSGVVIYPAWKLLDPSL